MLIKLQVKFKFDYYVRFSDRNYILFRIMSARVDSKVLNEGKFFQNIIIFSFFKIDFRVNII